MTEKKHKMVLDWMRKIHQLEYAHRYQSIRLSNIERVLGISAFIISTVIAFSYRLPHVETSTFNKLPFFLQRDYFVPIVSFVVAILTGLSTFLRPSEKSETHKKTGSNYEKLRHRIELIITTDYDEDELNKKLDGIKEEWERLDAINVSNKFFLKGKEKVKSFKKYPKELDFLEDIN